MTTSQSLSALWSDNACCCHLKELLGATEAGGGEGTPKPVDLDHTEAAWLWTTALARQALAAASVNVVLAAEPASSWCLSL